MFKVKHKIILVMTVCALTLSSGVARADTMMNMLDNYRQQLNDVNQQAAQQVQNRGDAMSQAKALQESADILKEAMKNNASVMAVHEKAISDIKDKEKVLDVKRQKDVTSFGNFLRYEYLNADLSTFDTMSYVFGASSLGDLIARASYVEDIIGGYKNLAVQVENDANEMEADKQVEESTLYKLNRDNDSQSIMQNRLNNAIEKQNDVIASLDAQSLKLLNDRSDLQKQMDYTQELVDTQLMEARYAQQDKSRGLNNEYSRIGSYTEPVKFNGDPNEIIRYAEIFLGTPYVWGGTSPNPGFDCSSLVQYTYAHFGISLPRVTWDQFDCGYPVSKENLETGDLVFFTTYAAGPSHVGIYIGDGIMIDDENRGVSYNDINSSYYINKFVGGRRIFEASDANQK